MFRKKEGQQRVCREEYWKEEKGESRVSGVKQEDHTEADTEMEC